MKQLPLIGILPGVLDGGDCSVGLSYVRAVEQAGGMSLLLPYTLSEQRLGRFAELCDGFLYTGGVDVHPARFGARVSPLCGEICPPRDELELAAFRHIYPTGKPVLGVCRGCQVLNVALGGTVVQDIEGELGAGVLHQRKSRHDPVPMHRIRIVPDTPLFRLLGKGEAVTNSYHHQCIGKLGRGMEVMARAEDGVIEAAYMPKHRFLFAIQWHPERDCMGKEIFGALIRASGR